MTNGVDADIKKNLCIERMHALEMLVKHNLTIKCQNTSNYLAVSNLQILIKTVELDQVSRCP